MDNQALLNYVQPLGPLPEVAGTKSGPLLIVGTAACIWDDLKAINNNFWLGDRLAVNQAAAYPEFIGRLDHVVSLHPELWPMLMHPHLYRYYRSGIPAPKTHAHRPTAEYGQPTLPTDYLWDLGVRGHCSGLFAIFIALLMGYDEIVLAGSPVDNTANFYRPPEEKTICGGEELQRLWQEVGALFGGRVKSLSGNTREWYGSPV